MKWMKRRLMNNPMIASLAGMKGNARACLWPEPLWGVPYNLYLPYASLFMAAHVLYIISYRLLAKSKGYRFFNGGVIAAVAIALACLVYFTVVCFQRNDFSMYFLCLLYLIVITANCATIFSYGWSSFKKKPYLILCAVGALSFFISDFIIGLDALAGIYDWGYLIWWLYPIGQILLNVFAF